MKTALITGITGQDGSYLAELLLSKNYKVHGLVRRASTFNTSRIDHIFSDLNLHFGDITDSGHLQSLVNEVKPDEIYNLAAQSHVKVSFEQPHYTALVSGVGALNILEAARTLDKSGHHVRVYQASSSEMYGDVAQIPQTETTVFRPQSPYACAKVYAYYMTINYRHAYDLFACNGVLFNHESPRRGETFVTRKITRAATRIKVGLQDKLALGNLNAKRDWGFAKDYVEAMWMMLQHDRPDDYVVATGHTYTVLEFVKLVFGLLDLDWEKHVVVDPKYFRPTEVEFLLGDPTKIKTVLGWKPKTSMETLAKIMTEFDYELAMQEKFLKSRGGASINDCLYN